MFTSFSVTARDGMRVSVPGVLSPAPDVHVAQSYDFGDFAFIRTSAGVVAIDAGTSPDSVRAAMADLGLKDHSRARHQPYDPLPSPASHTHPNPQRRKSGLTLDKKSKEDSICAGLLGMTDLPVRAAYLVYLRGTGAAAVAAVRRALCSRSLPLAR
jgi:hypothetical protein